MSINIGFYQVNIWLALFRFNSFWQVTLKRGIQMWYKQRSINRRYGPNVSLNSRKLHCKNILQLISRNKYYKSNLNIPVVWYLYCWKLVKQVNWSHFISPDSAIQNMVQSLVLFVILFHFSFEIWLQTSTLANIQQNL